MNGVRRMFPGVLERLNAPEGLGLDKKDNFLTEIIQKRKAFKEMRLIWPRLSLNDLNNEAISVFSKLQLSLIQKEPVGIMGSLSIALFEQWLRDPNSCKIQGDLTDVKLLALKRVDFDRQAWFQARYRFVHDVGGGYQRRLCVFEFRSAQESYPSRNWYFRRLPCIDEPINEGA